MSIKGRKLGRRLRCRLCNRKRYEFGGELLTLEAPRAYPSYPSEKEIVWLGTGEHVCSLHIWIRPQPERPEGVA